MNLKHIIASLFVACTVFTSCAVEEDEIFDQAATLRADATAKAYNDILVGAQNGWVMEYFPSAYQKYGGFVIACKFNANGTVDVSADYSTDEEGTFTDNSLYQVRQDDGLTLTFDTYNKVLHNLSDPSSEEGAGNGKGFEGDFDFNIISCTPEKVVLKGTKTEIKAELYPLKVSASEYLAAISKVENSVSTGSTLYAEVNGKEVDCSMTYNRFDIVYLDSEGKEQEVAIPFVYTDKGIKVYEPVEIAGVTVSEMVINAKGGFSTADGKVLIMPSVGPLDVFAQNFWYATYEDMGSWQQYWKAGYGKFATSGYVITEAIFYQAAEGYYAITFVVLDPETLKEEECTAYFTATVQNATNGVVQLKIYDVNSEFCLALYQSYGLNYLMYPFYGSATYQIMVDDTTNPTYMIMVDAKGNKMKLTADVRSNPFAALDAE